MCVKNSLHLLMLSLAWTLLDAQTFNENLADLVSEMQNASNPCTFVIYNMDQENTEIFARTAVTPLVILKHLPDAESAKELLSVRTSPCVILISYAGFANMTELKKLLEFTRHKTIVLFQNKGLPEVDNSYFTDDIVQVQKHDQQGKLVLSKTCSTTKDTRMEIWKLSDSDRTANLIDPYTSCSASLTNKKFVVSTSQLQPYVIILPNHRYKGAEMDTMNIIASKTGFNYDVKEEPIQTQRNATTNKWVGIAGSVISGAAQFGVGIMQFYRPGEISTFPVEFSPALHSLDNIFLTTRPKLLSPLGNFTRPFLPLLWVSIFLSMFACAAAAFILVRNNPKVSFWRMVFDFFGTLWAQNIKDTLLKPTSNPVSIVFGVWVLTMFFIHNAYWCNLRVSIIRKEYEKEVNTNEDLLKSGLDLWIPGGTSIVNLYKDSPSEVMRSLYRRAARRQTIFKFVNGMSPSDEQRLFRDGGARVLVKSRKDMQLMATERNLGYQPYRAGNAVVTSYLTTIIIPVYQPWSAQFNVVLMNVLEAGITDHLIDKYTPRNKYSYEVENNDEDKLEAYTFEHISGPLIVLAVGLLVAVIAFIAEVLIGVLK